MSKENDHIEDDVLEEEEHEDELENNEDEGSDDSTDFEQLYLAEKERREKAESAIIKNKEAKKKTKTVKNDTKQLSETAIEKTVLKAQGFTEEQLDLLEKIAHVNDISILEAKNNSIYKALQEEQQKQEEIKKASLPTSKKGKTRKISVEDTKEKLLSSDDDLTPEELELLIKNHKR